jgi:dihydropteroate synthase
VQADEFSSWLLSPHRRPLVMGVLNITPDSFSDGGQFSRPEEAVAQAMLMCEEGADLIDVGGESTRPGSLPVPEDEQIARVAPVIAGITGRMRVVISVDTTRARVAQAALDAGAGIVNDISAGRDDPEMFPLVARRGVPMVLMHMLGTPATMQQDPKYDDVVDEVRQFLVARAAEAARQGIDMNRILIDPGIGFGKTTRHNLELLRRLGELGALGRPLVLGVSRKRFIGEITQEPQPRQRVMGTAAAVAWGVANGAAVLRVHDVKQMTQVVRMIRAIQTGDTQ